MKLTLQMAGFGLASILVCGATPTVAKTHASARSTACWTQAKRQGLTGAERNAFHATCMEGALAGKRPVKAASSEGAKAITSPSGAGAATRSKQCNDEATRRGLHDSGFQAFRKGCLASAAPVGAIQTSLTPTTPTPAKPKLESLTNKPPK
jgi:hypothetical protein